MFAAPEYDLTFSQSISVFHQDQKKEILAV